MKKRAAPRSGLLAEVLHFDRASIRPYIGIRNAIGVFLPLALGASLGSLPSGLVAATGALNVAFSDSDLPYRIRAGRMLAASIVVGIGVAVGALCGGNQALIILCASAWAFAAGMLVALDQTAADLGTISLVTLVVFAALPLPPEQAVISGALALAGGLAQTAISVLLWPLRRHTAERRALAELFHGLAEMGPRQGTPYDPPAASAQSTRAQDALSALDRDYSVEAERYRALLSQAERIRLSLLALHRMSVRIERAEAPADTLAPLGRFLEICGKLMQMAGDELLDGAPRDPAALLIEGRAAADAVRQHPFEIGAEGMKLIDAIAGQFRATFDLMGRAIAENKPELASSDSWRPRRLRLRSTWATLRANLSLQSAACRHAIRLAGGVALAQALGFRLGLTRSYWAPMTVAIVLKPDFTATFSRGVLRLGGTLIGLLLTTVLFHVTSPAASSEVVLVALLTFVTRCYGPANYGIAATAITALVVLLVALNGVAPGPIILWRGLNTLLGGALSLAAYVAWPTWERTQVAETFARLLDRYAAYFQAVRRAYERPDERRFWDLDARRLAGRRARSNAEASMLRLAAEPATNAETLRLWSGVLANSHRLANALMALEAGVSVAGIGPPRAGFARFASDVEVVLHSLSAALRGSRLELRELPDLRQDHNFLVSAGDPGRYALVNVETDRIVNSLNTLAEEVVRWGADKPRS